MEKNNVINKSDEVKSLLKSEFDQDSSKYQICKVFKSEMGLRYKMTKKISFQGNSERNLVLR